jgi:hypothetical protein
MPIRSHKRGRAAPIKVLALATFATEQQVVAGSPLWSTISDWQQRGLVRLRWADSGAFAFVSLTERGAARVDADRAEPV